jgi:histidinol dehydrogenase
VQAMSFSNLYAPEHLIVNAKDAEQWEELIENAGRHIYPCSICPHPSVSVVQSRSKYFVFK